MSPLLYIISIEVLAVNLRAHPNIVGLRLPNVPSCLPVLSLYAEDACVIAIRAVFCIYDKFERGTGAKLNMEKCEGLWLGGWIHRLDCPVPIQWTSEKIKVLDVFLGNGNLDKCNWRSRLDSVTRCLNSWRSRHLSFTGRALVANALALSRMWYVASILPMPLWVLSEVNTVLFSFFWGGKKDLVARAVVVHPKPAKACFGAAPHDVFSNPASFAPERLPPFYASLLLAWRAIQGSSSSSSGLVVGSSHHADPVAVDSVSTKRCYVLLLSLSPCIPHCVSKFSPIYGPIDWKSTWASLYFLPLDRPVSDLNWKIAHDVLYTADRLISFGLDVPAACFCGAALETLAYLFFRCPLEERCRLGSNPSIYLLRRCPFVGRPSFTFWIL